MVTIEYDHSRLTAFFHHFYQITGKLIHLIYLVHIVFPGIVLLFCRCSCYGDLRVLNHLFCRIISMSLHTDCKYKILLLGRVQSVFDVRQKNIILRPSILCCLKNIHKLFTCKAVKTNIVKYLRTAVEITTVVVNRMGSVTECRKCSCCTFTYLILKLCLIRILARSEITQVHTCQHFKFCIGCSGSYRRNLKISGRIIFKHLAQIRNRIL